MQIELIETFLDLCDTRSFNRTADRLGVTQSTVSGRVKSLETSLGHRLFTRSRAGTELTTEGLRFVPHARTLQHDWTEARYAIRDLGSGAVTVRVGIQADMVGIHFNELIRDFRETLPEAAFLFEADYSAQMSSDLSTGIEDIAILFTPRFHPDLYFETLGEVRYVMVSTETDRLSEVRRETYIMPHFSDALPQIHANMLPELAKVSLSIGQNAAMVSLLESMGGTAYVLRDSAEKLQHSGGFRLVADAPPILLPIYAGIHIRNRHRPLHRRLLQILRTRFGPRDGQIARRRV
ncbi:MAG: LysR family transcriptional regulator [Albidovulum sp.]|uniref:LysR family transcriptional regulator n=1 Tax=Albidovulum sp. TaxID=1872424 RepID=UPI003C87310E